MQSFLSTYNNLSKDNLHVLGDIYTNDVVFIDPAHKIEGIEKLTGYFTKLYTNINDIRFEYERVIENDDVASIYWVMEYSHSKIAKGKLIKVTGNTLIKSNDEGKVFYHRDYFDLGEMLYEHIPILGSGVSFVKNKLGNI